MKKLNKIALSLSSVAAVAAPMAAVVSCGSDSGYAGRYDMPDDGTLRILTAFSKSGSQYKGLKTLVDEWNKKADKAFDIEITSVEGGYKAISPFLSTSFESGDTKKVPNIIIDYPDSLGTLSKYDMTIPLESAHTIKDLFNNEFTEINNQIGGVKPGGFYALPFAKSIDMLSINTSVMGHIFKMALDANMITDTTDVLGTDAKFKATADGWNTTGSDKGAVEGIWGTTIADQAGTDNENMADIKDILGQSGTMLDFVAKVTPLLTKKDADHQWILGIDSATNFIYQAMAQEVGKDAAMDYQSAINANFLFHRGDEGYINYTFKDHNSKAFKSFKKIYGKMKEAIKVGGVYFNIGGAYASGKEVIHKIGMAIGSTAGYDHNYVAGGKLPVVAGVPVSDYVDPFTIAAAPAANPAKRAAATAPAPATAGGALATGADKTEQDAFIKKQKDDNLLGTFSTKYNTPIYKSTIVPKFKSTFEFAKDKNGQVIQKDGVNVPAEVHVTGSHDVVLHDATADAAVAAFLADPNHAIATDKGMFVTSNKTVIDAAAAEDKVQLTSGKYAKYLIFSTTVNAGDVALQESELEVKNAPWQFDGQDDAKVQLVQGPSIIGVHSNAKEDAHVAEFVEWIMNGHMTAGYGSRAVTGTPAEIFSNISGYIVPTTTALSAAAPTGRVNPAQQITFDTLKAINDESDKHAFDNPVDDTTGHFREVLQSSVSAQMNEASADVRDAEAIYTSILRSTHI